MYMYMCPAVHACMGLYILLKFVDVFISVFAPEYLSLVEGVLVVLGRCMPPRFFHNFHVLHPSPILFRLSRPVFPKRLRDRGRKTRGSARKT